MKKASGLMLLVVLVGVVGCASKPVTPILAPAPTGKKTVAVMAVDQRPKVASKAVSADHLGEVGAAYGRPFTLTTENRAPVSLKMTENLTDGLRQNGWRTSAAPAVLATNQNQAWAALQGQSADRFLIVTLKDWESDTLASTDFHFDLEFSVLNPQGQVLAVERIQGRQNLGYPKFGQMSKTIRQAIEEETARVFTAALQKPALVAALQ